jgi:hypothetical protein
VEQKGAPGANRGDVRHTRRRHRRNGLGEMSVRRLTACLVVCSLGSVIAPVAAGASVASTSRTHDCRLPTDGWKPGDAGFLVGFGGQFHATLTTSGACAWMSTPHKGTVYLWPVGYRVRFHPTALLSPNGKVVAHQDQKVHAGGEAQVLSAQNVVSRYCGTAKQVVLIESPVLPGPVR